MKWEGLRDLSSRNGCTFDVEVGGRLGQNDVDEKEKEKTEKKKKKK